MHMKAAKVYDEFRLPQKTMAAAAMSTAPSSQGSYRGLKDRMARAKSLGTLEEITVRKPMMTSPRRTVHARLLSTNDLLDLTQSTGKIDGKNASQRQATAHAAFRKHDSDQDDVLDRTGLEAAFSDLDCCSETEDMNKALMYLDPSNKDRIELYDFLNYFEYLNMKAEQQNKRRSRSDSSLSSQKGLSIEPSLAEDDESEAAQRAEEDRFEILRKCVFAFADQSEGCLSDEAFDGFVASLGFDLTEQESYRWKMLLADDEGRLRAERICEWANRQLRQLNNFSAPKDVIEMQASGSCSSVRSTPVLTPRASPLEQEIILEEEDES
eukprot:Clim_evm26s108 gene=Clim_evmTU26s108